MATACMDSFKPAPEHFQATLWGIPDFITYIIMSSNLNGLIDNWQIVTFKGKLKVFISPFYSNSHETKMKRAHKNIPGFVIIRPFHEQTTLLSHFTSEKYHVISPDTWPGGCSDDTSGLKHTAEFYFKKSILLWIYLKVLVAWKCRLEEIYGPIQKILFDTLMFNLFFDTGSGAGWQGAHCGERDWWEPWWFNSNAVVIFHFPPRALFFKIFSLCLTVSFPSSVTEWFPFDLTGLLVSSRPLCPGHHIHSSVCV